MGYRLGVPLRGSLALEAAHGEGRVRGHRAPDLRGPRARWTSKSRWQSGDWTQRDLRREQQLREWLLLDGRIRNHLKVVRGAAATVVSVDAYAVSDPNLMLGLLPPAMAVPASASTGSAEPTAAAQPLAATAPSVPSVSVPARAPALRRPLPATAAGDVAGQE